MKITLIREEKESGKETVSTCEADALLVIFLTILKIHT